MSYPDRIPISLRIVTWLVILIGVVSAVDFTYNLGHGKFSLNAGILYVFVGYGMINLRSDCRLYVLVINWLALAVIIAIGGMALLEGSSGANQHSIGGWIGIACLLGILLWSQWVLMRKDVREAFEFVTNQDPLPAPKRKTWYTMGILFVVLLAAAFVIDLLKK